MKKKITVMILALGLCVSMSGCSDDGTDENYNPVECGWQLADIQRR